LAEHLRRLQASLYSIRLANPYPDAEWTALINTLIEKNTSEDQSIYLHITRGVAPRDHAFPANTPATVFMMSNPLITSTRAQCEAGVAAVSAIDNRWGRCDIKTIALLPNVLLRQMAVDVGAVETVLFRDGFLTEGAASNIFAVKKGVILAPPKDHHMLAGITYDLVLELAEAHKIPTDVRKLTEARVRAADELWITSSTKEVMPIVQLDGKPVGKGKPCAVFWQMYELYQAYKQQVMRHGSP